MTGLHSSDNIPLVHSPGVSMVRVEAQRKEQEKVLGQKFRAAQVTPAVTEQPKSRQKLAAESMSKVQNLHRALQSVLLKSELRTVSEAIHAARGLYQQITAAGCQLRTSRSTLRTWDQTCPRSTHNRLNLEKKPLSRRSCPGKGGAALWLVLRSAFVIGSVGIGLWACGHSLGRLW